MNTINLSEWKARSAIKIISSAVKRLIAINRIQNKSVFNIIYVCTVYIYYVYINTHTCMYIFKKICYVYILNIFIYNINYMNINIYI